MATFYQDAAGNWKISGPHKKYTDEEFGKLVESEPLESRINRYQRLNQYWNEYKGLGLNVGDAPTPAEFGLDSTGTSLPSSTTGQTPGTTAETTSPTYTTPTDYTAPAATPTANAPTLPTGNVAAATASSTPTYGGATTYSKKYKSPFAASGAWPVSNKKYPYKSSLFKTQTSELL